jgi:hypothetical protein
MYSSLDVFHGGLGINKLHFLFSSVKFLKLSIIEMNWIWTHIETNADPQHCRQKSLSSEADPYLVVKCGKEKAESLVQANTTDPVWNFSAIFYRSRPEKDALKIQVELASGTLYVLGIANYGRQQIRIYTDTRTRK